MFHHLARFASQFADRFAIRESYLHVECHWKQYEATVIANGGQGTGNGKWKTGNVERGTEKGEPEPGTESTSAEIGSSERWEVRTLQLSHVVFSVTSNHFFFIFVLILCFFSVSFFSLFFIYLIFFSKVCLLKCIREVDPRIYVCGPRNLNFIVYYCRKRLKWTPQKQLTRQLVYTEKHISNFNLFNLQILPVMKTEKLKLD